MSKRNLNQFEPFKLVIGIDNIEELAYLWAIFNTSPDTVLQALQSNVPELKDYITPEIFDKIMNSGIEDLPVYNTLIEKMELYFDEFGRSNNLVKSNNVAPAPSNQPANKYPCDADDWNGDCSGCSINED